jgi:hypothetical protein
MCSRFKIGFLLAACGVACFATGARADVQAYTLTSDGEEFGQIDLTTGAWTDIGSTLRNKVVLACGRSIL